MAFSMNGLGYMGTGHDGTSATQEFYEYTWADGEMGGSWTQIADFGGGKRWLGTGFVIGCSAYAGTGVNDNDQNDFWKYSIPGNTSMYRYYW